MNKIHEKSPCCGVGIRLFGARRRQCSFCKKTWRVWKKKRGRKRIRTSLNILSQYFERKFKSTRLEKRTFSARLRSLVEKFNTQTPWPEIPKGPLVVVADGLIEYIEKKKYTVYFILLRSLTGSKAVITPPYIRMGGEVVRGWHEAFELLPNDVFERIEALVCDGHGGLLYLAKTSGWKLQRCQFHLLARIAHNASFGCMNRSAAIGLRIKRLVEVVLYTCEEDDLAISLALESLQKIKKQIRSRSFKTVISGFLRHYQDFRTYLVFPQYHLPTTSNSAEHLIGLIRDLQYRARGFRTPKSLFVWITAFCKYQKSVTCRGKNQPN